MRGRLFSPRHPSSSSSSAAAALSSKGGLLPSSSSSSSSSSSRGNRFAINTIEGYFTHAVAVRVEHGVVRFAELLLRRGCEHGEW